MDIYTQINSIKGKINSQYILKNISHLSSTGNQAYPPHGVPIVTMWPPHRFRHLYLTYLLLPLFVWLAQHHLLR